MSLFRLLRRTSRGRRLNIKRVILFPIIVFAAYIFVHRFMPVFMFFLFGCCIIGLVKIDSGDNPMRFTRMKT